MNAWRPLGYEYNAIECYTVCKEKPWYQLAYDYDYTDQYYFVDGEGNGVDDWYDWYDWKWQNPEGDEIAQTDAEFYKYHFGNIVREYQLEVQDSLGMVREMSLALGGSFYHYGERFWLHAWADAYPKRWIDENVSEHTFEHIDLSDERVDYTLGFILGTKLGKRGRFGTFIEGDYSQMWEREWYSIKAGINYLFF